MSKTNPITENNVLKKIEILNYNPAIEYDKAIDILTKINGVTVIIPVGSTLGLINGIITNTENFENIKNAVANDNILPLLTTVPTDIFGITSILGIVFTVSINKTIAIEKANGIEEKEMFLYHVEPVLINLCLLSGNDYDTAVLATKLQLKEYRDANLSATEIYRDLMTRYELNFKSSIKNPNYKNQKLHLLNRF